MVVDDAPTVVRYPKGPLPDVLPAVERVEGIDVVARGSGEGTSVLLVGVGSMVPVAVEVAALLGAHGLDVDVVDPVWVLPVPDALVKMAGEHEHVVVLEDGLVEGGIGALLGQRCADAGLRMPVHAVGIPRDFLPHATRAQLVETLRLRPADIAHDVLGWVAAP